MKKVLFTIALCLIMFGSGANAQSRPEAMAIDSKNLYFTTSEFESFVVMDKETGHMEFYDKKNSGLRFGTMGNLFGGVVAKDGEVWFVANTRLNHYSNGKIEMIRDATPVQGGYLDDPSMDAEGNLWSFWRNGCFLEKYNPQTGEKEEYQFTRERGDLSTYGGYVITKSGDVWIEAHLSLEGYALVKLSNGEFSKIYSPENLPIWGICLDDQENIWYGTRTEDKRGFIVKFDGSTFETAEIPQDAPLPYASRLAFDGAGRLWAMTSFADTAIVCMENGTFTTYRLPTTKADLRFPDGRICEPHEFICGFEADGDVVYILTQKIVYAVNPETGEQDRYGLTHRRATLYTIKDGKIDVKEIVPEAISGKSETGINSLTTDAQADVMYDLQGRRVNGEATKGVYIQNGKKFIKE